MVGGRGGWRQVSMSLDALGYTRATMAGTVGRDGVTLSQSSKTGLSSDCGLQLDHMKLESLVIVDQNATVNTFSSLVLTARQLKGVGGTRSTA
jgi:hypothetical protein